MYKIYTFFVVILCTIFIINVSEVLAVPVISLADTVAKNLQPSHKPASKAKLVKSVAVTSVKTTRHNRTLNVSGIELTPLVRSVIPADSFNYVLQASDDGGTAKVYFFKSDTVTVIAAVAVPGRYIDMFSAAPISLYSLSAANATYYNLNFDKTPDVLALRSVDNNIVTLGLAAFTADTVKPRILEHIPDSLRARVLIVKLRERIGVMSMDSLKLLAKKYRNDTLKAPVLAEIANRYMDYDTLSNKRLRQSYQNNALTYSTLAMQQYYKYGDSAGMTVSFDNMSKIYYSQKKFSQAKWFALQSNSLSRGKSDIPGVVNSLIMLAVIKSEINDYPLAMRDLNEALELSVKYKYPKLQSLVLKNFGLLYSRLKNYPKEEMVLKKRDSLEAAIQKHEQDSLLAKVNFADSLQTKKIDSLQIKKKLYTSNTKKLSKNSSGRKTDSL